MSLGDDVASQSAATEDEWDARFREITRRIEDAQDRGDMAAQGAAWEEADKYLVERYFKNTGFSILMLFAVTLACSCCLCSGC